MLSILAVYCFIAVLFVVQTNGFQVGNRFSNQITRSSRKCGTSMMFGGGGKGGGKIVVKVEGKTLESSEKTVNLRKFLQEKKVEVYPLKAKVLGNCGGAGICGTCAVKGMLSLVSFHFIFYLSIFISI